MASVSQDSDAVLQNLTRQILNFGIFRELAKVCL